VRLGRVLFTNRNVVCTDCTLVGGDSGGPLWNMDGQVVGIHSRIGWQITTNFHVPIATYKETWTRLVAGEMWGGTFDDGTVGVRPLLGAAGDATAKPCKVRQVFPGSPAQAAGLIAGDVIKKFDGAEVGNFNDLAKLLQEKQAGQKIAVDVARGDQQLSLELTLGGRHQQLPGGLEDPEE
jgi:serine protease Do